MAGEMKVYIPTSENPKSGKGFFCQRLAKAVVALGVQNVSSPEEKHDVSLHNVKLRNAKSRVKVLRLDGVYHDIKMAYQSRNREIAKNLNRANAVVYQSAYAKSLCNKYLGSPKKPHAVIHNGADPAAFQVQPAESDFKHNFLAASRWRPHKRLPDIVQSFLEAEIEDSCLFVAGDLKKSGVSKSSQAKMFSHSNVKYLGVLAQPELMRYLRLVNATIHLCWFDACPNSVVESLCAGVPVICNNTGGTPELVTASGGNYVCDVDKPYNLKPVDLYHPPRINRDLIAQAMRRSISEKVEVNSEPFDICNVAKQYIAFFERLL